MNRNIITKILGVTLPDDIIYEISSYFIQKISKNDIRYSVIERFIYYNYFYETQGFYSDGIFRYKLFVHPIKKGVYFLLHSLPKLFIEYQYCINNSINLIRFWISDNKCEVLVDERWVVKT
jgi:hypothetical protein